MKFIVALAVCTSLLASVADPASAAYSGATKHVDAMFGTATLTAPTGVTATTYSCGMRIAWTNSMSFAPTSWKIQRYTVIGVLVSGSTVTVPGSQLSYDDATGVSIGIGYTWHVWPVYGTNWVGPSAASASKIVISLCL